MAGIKQQASPVLLGRTTEVEVVDPVQPELYGTLTNRFGGNAFMKEALPNPHPSVYIGNPLKGV
jgi:hypothetical protein